MYSLKRTGYIYLGYRLVVMFWKRSIYGLKNVHPTFFMAGRSTVSRDLVAGAHSFIAEGCRICPKVTLERYVMFGPHVVVTGSDHRFDVPGVPVIFAGRPLLKETVIEADVWIGYGAIIMAGVRVGRGAIVAAGSVVTKDIPEFEIHAGIPAKKIRNRFENAEYVAKHSAMLDGAIVRPRYSETLGS